MWGSVRLTGQNSCSVVALQSSGASRCRSFVSVSMRSRVRGLWMERRPARPAAAFEAGAARGSEGTVYICAL